MAVPAMANDSAASSADSSEGGGYRYADGLPTDLPAGLAALRVPVPAFESDAPPPAKVSAAVRAAWAEALAELDERNEKRAGAHMAGGIAGSIMIGGAAAAMGCSVQ